MTSNGTLTVVDSSISNNRTTAQSGFAGGIRILSSSVTISGSTIAGNTVGHEGGGLYKSDGGPLVTISDSTIANNAAGLRGGGILSPAGYSRSPTARFRATAQPTGVGSITTC